MHRVSHEGKDCTKFLNQYSFICSEFYKLYKYNINISHSKTTGLRNSSNNLNWWTLVKSLTGNNDLSRTMPPIEHNGNLVFDDIEKSELFSKFFYEQSTLDDSDHTHSDVKFVILVGLSFDKIFIFGFFCV